MSTPRRRSSTVPPFLVQENWLDRAIEEARERGDFDDLPGHGQPLHLESNDLAPEWDMAFRVLKNAGFVPIWMELGKTTETASAELTDFLEQTRRDLTERVARANANRRADIASTDEAGGNRSKSARWWPFWPRQRESRRAVETPVDATWSELKALRQRARQRYLELAERLDAIIVEYHRELPDDLWRLQRVRRTAEAAARTFDSACPPIQDGGWTTDPSNALDPPGTT